MTEQETTHQGPGVYGGLETHRGHRHECPAPDCGPQGVRIVPNHPDDDEGVTIHFPQVDYCDTQVWSVDVGVSTDTLRELRDAIDNHLGTSVKGRIAALHAPVQHMGQVWCGECSVRRSTGPKAEEWVALIPHPCPTIDVLDSKETAEIDEQVNEDPCRGDTAENGAWHSVWLHGKWESLTRRMSTAEREYAAERVASYSRHLAECDNDPGRGEPMGLRWWREAGR